MSSSSEELDNIIEDLLLSPSVVSFFLDDTHARNSRSLNDSSSSIRVKKPRRDIERGREEGHKKLFDDYFSENPTYNEDLFRRRFRMRRNLFLRIVDGVSTHDSYFQNKQDATGRQGLSPLQKCTAAMRMLAYGVAADAVDEYIRIGESTTIKCVKRFVCAIIAVFGDEYLRRPNTEDIERLLHKGQQRGFPGMLGSLDCMHWEWKNCPVAWHGQYRRGDHNHPTIMLEAVASYDLWIWHAFFGLPGTLNDINVLECSPLFHEVLEGMAPRVAFTVNGNNYNLGYYLIDGIYPNWAIFVKSIPLPQGAKAQLFARRQEAVRKDVERAFGVLQARFAIISGPTWLWCKDTIGQIMRACVIIHNMIVEDEKDKYADDDNTWFDDEVNGIVSRPETSRGRLASFQQYLRNHLKVRNRSTNQQLKEDLIEHIWNQFRREDTD